MALLADVLIEIQEQVTVGDEEVGFPLQIYFSCQYSYRNGLALTQLLFAGERLGRNSRRHGI